MIDPATAADALAADLDSVRGNINEFTAATFQCRGGRIGSGMGLCLEGLWGFYARQALDNRLPGSFQIAWLPEHEYNDFAVIHDPENWKPGTRNGELFRIEVKSMNLDADESKGHFDVQAHEIGQFDQLLVIAWRWAIVADQLVYPRVIGQYLGDAREVAALRDALHLARGGSFVDTQTCPDGCDPAQCSHGGEPLNPRGTRERRSGPVRSVTGAIAYAANFGGLVRMIKVRGCEATAQLEEQREMHPTRKLYIDFIRSFPTLREEL